MRRVCGIAVSIVLFSFLATAQQPAAKSAFDPIKFFVGRWQGSTHGEPGKGEGERNYEFVLRGRFIRVTNKTIYPAQEKNATT